MLMLLEQAGTQPQGSLLTMILPLIILGVVFYFFMYRPQKKQDKAQNDMRNNLTVGDEITTIGGIVGKIVDIKDENIVIETSADRVRMELAKWSVMTNNTAQEAAQKARAEAQAAAKERAAKRKAEKAEKKKKKDF